VEFALYLITFSSILIYQIFLLNKMVLFVLVRAENGKWENGKWKMGIWGFGEVGKWEDWKLGNGNWNS
jgi:hypothetical protein